MELRLPDLDSRHVDTGDSQSSSSVSSSATAVGVACPPGAFLVGERKQSLVASERQARSKANAMSPGKNKSGPRQSPSKDACLHIVFKGSAPCIVGSDLGFEGSDDVRRAKAGEKCKVEENWETNEIDLACIVLHVQCFL